MSAFLIKAFAVQVQGFSEINYYAASRGKALAAAWGDYNNYSQTTFGEFLRIVKTAPGLTDERFGEAMMVGGKLAFYVSHNSQYIQFAYADGTEVFNTHPLDVEPPHARRGTPYYEAPKVAA